MAAARGPRAPQPDAILQLTLREHYLDRTALALETACFDIMGKATGRPVYQLLGAGYRDRVRAYASTLFRPTPEAMAEAARGYVAQGFTAIKFGWGVFGEDPGRDVELVAAAREAVGPGVELMVDCGWLVRSAYLAYASQPA